MSVVRIGELREATSTDNAGTIPKWARNSEITQRLESLAQVVAIIELTLPHIPLRR